MNALKSIYSRITTMPEAIASLGEVGVSIRNSNGDVRNASEVIADLAGKWHNLSQTQQQNLGVQIAGRQQLSRFLALMNNYQMAVNSTNDAINSQGSAMRENERYMQSMQAKINVLKVSWNEFSLAVGEAFITPVFMGLVSALTSLANVGTKVTETFGFLPSVMTLIVVSLTLLSSKFRAYSIELVKTTTYTGLLSKATTGLASAFDLLKKNFRGLLVSSAVGAIFVALSFSLEKLIQKSYEAKQAQEELESQNAQVADSYIANRDEINDLIDRYEELNEKITRNSEEEAEYATIKQQLSDMMPTLVDRIDEQGNAHLKTADAMREELKVAKELAKQKLNDTVTTEGNSMSKTLKEIEKLEDERKKLQEQTVKDLKVEESNSIWSTARDMLLPKFHWAEVVTDDDIEKNEIKVKKMEKQMADLGDDLKSSFENINNLSLDLNLDLGDAFSEADMSVLEDTMNSLYDSINSKVFLQLGSETVTKTSQQLGEAVAKYKNAIESGDASKSEISKIEKNIRDLLELLQVGQPTIENFIFSLTNGANAIEGFNIATVESLSDMSDLLTAYEETGDEIGVYNTLLERMTEGKTLTTAEAMDLIGKEQELASAISIENGMVQVNIDAVRTMRDAKITSFQDIIEARRQEVQVQSQLLVKQIGMDKLSVSSIQTVADARKALADIESERDTYYDNIRSGKSGYVSMYEMYDYDKEYEQNVKGINAVSDALAQLDQLQNMAGSALPTIGTQFETYDGMEDATEELKDYIFVLNKYETAMAEVNRNIEKHNRLQSVLLKYSQRYRQSLQQELVWLRKKNELQREEARSLEKQIKSGNITQYGVVETGTTTKVSSGSSYQASSTASTKKAYTGQYANYINKYANQYNVDPFLIAALIQTESGFRPNVGSSAGAYGLMQLMPATARGLGVNRYDIEDNIKGGTKYLAQMLEKYGGDVQKALYAYNAGAGNVNKILSSGSGSWKEPKNHYTRTMANYQQFAGTSYGSATYSASSSGGNSVAQDYLSWRQTSSFNENRGSYSHGGLDLVKTRGGGDYVRALTSGKVTQAYYSKSGGYMVVIQQDDGLVSKYMHMQKGLNVKAGDTVSAGTILGKVGNTGNSSGAHLHLQLESGGVKIDPLPYLQQLASTVQQSTKTSTFNASQAQAEHEQTLADAKQTLADLYMSIKDTDLDIEELLTEITMSYTYPIEEKIRQQTLLANRISLATYNLNTSTKAYRDELTSQRTVLVEKGKLIEKERKLVGELMASTSITDSARAQLLDKMDELFQQRYENAAQRDQITMEIIQSYLESYVDMMDYLSLELEKIRFLQDQVNENSDRFKELVLEEVQVLVRNRNAIAEQIRELESALRWHSLTPEQKKEITYQIRDLSAQYLTATNEIRDISESLADDSINVLKDTIKKQQEITVAGLEKDLEEHRKKHEEKMDLYDEELKAYEKIINEKLRLLDDQMSQDQYDKQLRKLQEEEAKLRNKIDILRLDNSQDAIARRIQLEEELDAKVEEIDELKYQREMELRKQALNDELDRYKEEVDQAIKSEDEKLEKIEESTERKIDDANAYYEEILADEAYFNKLREEMLEGNVGNMQTILNQYLNNFKSYNQEVIKELGLNWNELQTHISTIANTSIGVGIIPSIVETEQNAYLGDNPKEIISAWETYLSNKRKFLKATTPEEKLKITEQNKALREQYGFIDAGPDVLEYADISEIQNTDPNYIAKLKAFYQYVENKKNYEQGTGTKKKSQLKAENEILRAKWGFQDGSYDQLKDVKVKYDGSSRTDLLSSISSPSSTVSSLSSNITGGTTTSQMSIDTARLLSDGLSQSLANIQTAISRAISGINTSTTNTTTTTVNFNVENLGTSQSEADTFVEYTVNKLKTSGVL